MKNFGKGGTMLHNEAISVGMVDGLGSLEQLIKTKLEGDVMTQIITGYNAVDDEKLLIAENKEMSAANSNVKAAEDEEDDEMEQEDIDVPPTDDEDKEEDAMEDEKDKKDDELESMINQYSAEKSAFKKANRRAFNSIIAEGIAKERNRIKAIYEMSKHTGHKSFMFNAMFGSSLTPEQVSHELFQLDIKQKAAYLKDVKKDAKEIPYVPHSSTDEEPYAATNEKKSEQKAKVETDDIVAGALAARGKMFNGGKNGSS
jgi:hypothetical protein